MTNETLDYVRVIAAHAARCTARHGVGSHAVPPTIMDLESVRIGRLKDHARPHDLIAPPLLHYVDPQPARRP